MKYPAKNDTKIKSILLLFFMTIIGLSLDAQITINDLDMPFEGDTVHISNGINLDFIDLEETGADFFWDFSQLQPISQRTDTFLSPWSLPLVYKLVFGLSSNLAVRAAENIPIPGFPLTDIYNFYDNRNSSFRSIGMGVTLLGLQLPIKFDTPDVVYPFPLNYLDSWSSQAHFEQGIPNMGYLRLTKNHHDTIDGWGRLKTPYGTFDVLRLKSEVTEIDSIYMDTLGIGIPINRNYTVYQWLAKDQQLPLLQITSNLGGLVVAYKDSVRFIIDDVTELPSIKNNDWHISPNPAKDHLHIAFDLLVSTEIKIKLFDLSGREVATIYEGQLNNGYHKLHIPIESMAIKPNYYIVQLIANESYMNKKILLKP